MKRLSAEVLLLTVLLAGCEPAPSNVPKGPTRPVSSAPGPGKLAPDIAGTDIDGVAFKLSDYRGKVIMLDFWGSW